MGLFSGSKRKKQGKSVQPQMGPTASTQDGKAPHITTLASASSLGKSPDQLVVRSYRRTSENETPWALISRREALQ